MTRIVNSDDLTMELLRKHLDQDFTLFPMSPSVASINSVRDIETEFGITFPEEYVAHLIGAGDGPLEGRGVFIEAKESVWPTPKELDVKATWQLMNGLHTYSASGRSEDWMRLDATTRNFLAQTGIHAIPILKILGSDDMYCAYGRGMIGWYSQAKNVLEPVGGSFWEIFETELKELAHRKERIIRATTA